MTPLAAMAGLVVAGRRGAFATTEPELEERYGRAASRFLDVDGVRVHHHDEGEGPAIVFAHGSYGNVRGWDRVVARLVGSHRCIRWDQPGMGLSTVDPARLDPDLDGLQVMERLLDHLDVERATIVATSSGGTLATAYASAHPDRVSGLVIANAPPDPVVFREIDRPAWLGAALAFADDVVRHRPRMLWHLYLRSLWGQPERLEPGLVREYRDFWAATRPDAPAHLILRNGTTEASRARLAGVQCPVRVVWGMRDYVLPPATLDTYVERFTQAEVDIVTWDDVGHYPPLEVPDRFAELVADFLDGHTG